MSNTFDISPSNTETVDVYAVAANREARLARQRELLKKFNRPLVCLSMNIAGQIKTGFLVEFAFNHTVDLVLEQINLLHGTVLKSEIFRQNTGCEAVFAIDNIDAGALKQMGQAIEETHIAGRLMDIDIISADSTHLNRSMPRKCLICDNEAKLCARSMAHSLDILTAYTRELLLSFLHHQLANAATKALIDEVHVTPKPGLVDEISQGAHSDMDICMFEKSAWALNPFFREISCFTLANAEQINSNPALLMEGLKQIGLNAESAMLEATGGVNTHRGALFAIGLLLAGTVLCITHGRQPAPESVCSLASTLAKQHILAPECSSHGSRMCKKYGVKGAMGEAADGFKTVLMAVEMINYYYETEQLNPYAYALLNIMEQLDDTNVLKRGGRSGASFIKLSARQVLNMPESERETALIQLDMELTKRNISCGGAADILAAAIFLFAVNKQLSADKYTFCHK